ncbi:MAG TPA: phage baseplate assembly protein V [Ilumatobacteraceae bacterium]|nr:phage baseplate assembly protein V [Ilumatobacteraceae bacterium]
MIDKIKVVIGGSPEELPNLIDVRIEAAMSATATCDLTLLASRTGSVEPLSSRMTIGASIEIRGGDSDNSITSIFKGHVLSITWEIDADVGEFIVVRAMDKSYKLWNDSPRRALLKQNYADVIKTIAGEMGMSHQVTSGPLTAVHEYQLQTTSNGELLHQIMARTGCFWTVVGEKLIVSEGSESPSSTVSVTYGLNLIRLKARVSGVGVGKKVDVRSWDPSSQKLISANDSSNDVVLESNLDKYLDKIDKDVSGASTMSSHHVTADQSVATSVAKSLRRRSKAGQLQVRMERRGGDHLADLWPGGAVDVSGAGDDLNGMYRIASVVHAFNEQGWRSTITTGTLEPPTLPEISNEAVRVEAWSRLGPVIGVVSNNKPEEGKHAGMVKVKFHTIDDQVESAWARVVSVAGGKSRGMIAIPEVDDEVLVVFEQGDTTRPIVLGGLWSENKPTPVGTDKYVENGKVKVWSIHSRTGQRITVTDGGDEKEQNIKISMPKDKIFLHVGNDKVELFADTKTLELQSGKASVLLDGKGAITINADSSLTLKAKQDITIEGMNVTIKAQQNFKAEGQVGVEVKGGATGKLESSGPLTVKGAIVQIN